MAARFYTPAGRAYAITAWKLSNLYKLLTVVTSLGFIVLIYLELTETINMKIAVASSLVLCVLWLLKVPLETRIVKNNPKEYFAQLDKEFSKNSIYNAIAGLLMIGACISVIYSLIK